MDRHFLIRQGNRPFRIEIRILLLDLNQSSVRIEIRILLLELNQLSVRIEIRIFLLEMKQRKLFSHLTTFSVTHCCQAQVHTYKSPHSYIALLS